LQDNFKDNLAEDFVELQKQLFTGHEFSDEETSEVDFEDGNENCDSICSSQSGDDHDLEFFSENF
jgi:hypothetical protein